MSIGDEVQEEDVAPKRSRAKKEVEKAKGYIEKDYIVSQEVEVNGKIVLKDVLKPEYRTLIGKCKLRAAKRYDVSVEHLTSAYRTLNGKKVDGYYVNDLVDRYGFSNPARAENRPCLSARYGINNPNTVDIAEDKLQLILRESDVMVAYAKYIGDGMAVVRAGIEEKAVIGG